MQWLVDIYTLSAHYFRRYQIVYGYIFANVSVFISTFECNYCVYSTLPNEEFMMVLTMLQIGEKKKHLTSESNRLHCRGILQRFTQTTMEGGWGLIVQSKDAL